MQVAIVSDIHGNRHALEAVLADTCAHGAEEVWCLGDLVGYGAEPDACVELVRAHCALVLAGNHDLAVTGALAVDEFSPNAATAARWTREAIAPAHLEYLRGLFPQATRGALGLYHASPRDPVWEYVLSTVLAELCLDAAPERVCFVGHSHVALSFVRPAGAAATGTPREADETAMLDASEWILNPGSVGQPRDGDPRAAWLLLDTDAWRAQWRRTPYDVEGAARAILDAGLPRSLADRLGYGQ